MKLRIDNDNDNDKEKVGGRRRSLATSTTTTRTLEQRLPTPHQEVNYTKNNSQHKKEMLSVDI